MTIDLLKTLFAYNNHVINANTEGISARESLVQPGESGHCLNWVVGHMLEHRNRILAVLGEAAVLSDQDFSAYARGTGRLAGGEAPVPFDHLLEGFRDSQKRLDRGLERLSEEKLRQDTGERTLWETLALLQFHEAYHAGQAGLLRRILGREGAIK